MTRAEETVLAILRRYREWVAAQYPAEWPARRELYYLSRFAAKPSDEHRFRDAAVAIIDLFRFLKQPRPSQRSVTRILAALAPQETITGATDPAR